LDAKGMSAARKYFQIEKLDMTFDFGSRRAARLGLILGQAARRPMGEFLFWDIRT
jgi:hypothetical protein